MPAFVDGDAGGAAAAADAWRAGGWAGWRWTGGAAAGGGGGGVGLAGACLLLLVAALLAANLVLMWQLLAVQSRLVGVLERLPNQSC